MFNSKKNIFGKGVTLIELLIVIFVITLLTGIIFSTFVSYKKNEALLHDTETIVETLRQARDQTISSQNSSQYGVHLSSGKITMFTGSSYAAGNAGNQDFTLSSTDTLLTISLAGGGSDVIFNRLSGETNQNGTVVVSSPSMPETKTVTIYKTGTVDSQ